MGTKRSIEKAPLARPVQEVALELQAKDLEVRRAELDEFMREGNENQESLAGIGNKIRELESIIAKNCPKEYAKMNRAN